MSEEYRKLFLTEAKELMEKYKKMLLQLESGDLKALDEIYRILHTIKGSAGVMGFQPITEVAHQTEDLIRLARDKKVEISEEILNKLYESLDFFKNAIRAVEKEEPIPTGKVIALRIEIEETPFVAARASVIISQLQKLGIITHSTPNQDEIEAGWTGSKLEVEIQTDRSDKDIIANISSIPEVISVTPYEPGISIPEVRISVESLDQILALASELSRNITNLESALGKSADPRVVNIIDIVSGNLVRLRDELLGIRLIPLTNLFRQFPTWFRSESTKLGKEADLTIRGGEIEVDRAIFEYLREPIIHILRNALVHGIETKKERKGKKPGMVKLEARKEGDDLILSVTDNGRGIDSAKVLKTALDLKLINQTQASKFTTEQTLMLLSDPRFTTLKSATQLGGRGVGLDVVKKKMDEIGGELSISSQLGQGSTFILTIPLSLAIVKSMIIEVGNNRFAVPFSILKDTMTLNSQQTHSLLKQRYLLDKNDLIPLFNLNNLLGLSENGTPRQVLVTEIENQPYAFAVDQLKEPMDLLVRPLEKELGPYIGASIHPDGLPILHIDLRKITRELKQ